MLLRNLSVSKLSVYSNKDSVSKLPGISMSKGLRDIDHLSKNLYSKNLEHRIFGQDSPGPAFYDNQMNNVGNLTNCDTFQTRKKSMVTSFPKSKRHLSDVRVDYYLGPSSYQAQDNF